MMHQEVLEAALAHVVCFFPTLVCGSCCISQRASFSAVEGNLVRLEPL
jgi:hypothetical protein